MKNKLLFPLIFFLTLNVFSSGVNNQILNELSPINITASSGKGSVYIKVGESSVYLLNITKESTSKAVFVVYDIFNKKYITEKVHGSVEITLKKDMLYAIIYVTTPNDSIRFSLTDLDLSILSEVTPRAVASSIKKGNDKFNIDDLTNLELGAKLKKYILRTYKNNIYVVYQLSNNSDIKISGYIQNVGWFDINNAVNGNITDVEDFDFTINFKGELYIAFVTRASKNFNSELIVKKFNSRKWIDISPLYIQNVGSLVNITSNKDNNLYISYLEEQNGEYKIILIENEEYGKTWKNIANSYITNGDANVNASNIGLIADPFLGFFYNYKTDNEVKSEFIINRGKSWENTNTQSTYMASSIKILFDSSENEIFMGYISGNRPVVTSNDLLENKWKNLSPSISNISNNSSLDIKKHKNFLFLALEDNLNIKLIYNKNDDWYYFNDIELFKSNSSMPQLENYGNTLIFSYFDINIGALSFKALQ